jgi:flagellar biosynthetic protein FlhB
MAEGEGGEKTEQPTAKRLQEAFEMGNFARSPEISTALMLGAAILILTIMVPRMFETFKLYMVGSLAQLSRPSLDGDAVAHLFGNFLVQAGYCVLPVMGVALISALLSGGLQSRFHLTFRALEPKWDRLNPWPGLEQMFKMQSLVRLGVNLLKLGVLAGLTYPVVKELVQDPVFHAATDFNYLLHFMGQTAQTVGVRVLLGLALVAAADYGYHLWQHQQQMLMTKEEVKEEQKSSEGNLQVKGEFRKRRRDLLRQKWLLEIPKADVIVTNPTHLSVALRYDRKSMGAPRVVAKGSRFNALRIREIAKEHQIPIIENKPVARMLFKHCKEGQEILPQLYAAVAEILAYVYRVNRYRYYIQGQQLPA